MFSFEIRMYECKHSSFKIFCKVCFSNHGLSDCQELSQLYLQLVDAYKKRSVPQNGQVVVLKCYPILKKMRKFQLKAQFHSQKESRKQEAMAVSTRKGTLLSL